MFTQSAANISMFDHLELMDEKASPAQLILTNQHEKWLKRFNGETDKRMFVQGLKASDHQKFQLKKGDFNRNNT